MPDPTHIAQRLRLALWGPFNPLVHPRAGGPKPDFETFSAPRVRYWPDDDPSPKAYSAPSPFRNVRLLESVAMPACGLKWGTVSMCDFCGERHERGCLSTRWPTQKEVRNRTADAYLRGL